MGSRMGQILLIILITIVLSRCDSKELPPTPIPKKQIPAEVIAILEEMNSWPSEALDIIECHERYPPIVDTGETISWIISRREMLREMGYHVRWNCHQMKYEIAEDETPLCDCPPPTP